MSTARLLADLVRFSADKMQKVPVFDPAAMLVDLYCLLPGQFQKIHAHAASDKVYVCLRGRLVATIGDEELSLEPGTATFAPAGTAHGVRNDEAAEAVALVMTAPRP